MKILNKKFSDLPISKNDENNFILNNIWNLQNENVLRIYNNNSHIFLLWKNKINNYFKKTIFQLDFELNYKYFEGIYNIQNIIKRLVYLFNTEKYNLKENDDKVIIGFEKVKCIDDHRRQPADGITADRIGIVIEAVENISLRIIADGQPVSVHDVVKDIRSYIIVYINGQPRRDPVYKTAE